MSPLELNIPTRVAELARAFVRNKYATDKAVAEMGAAMLAGDLHDGGYGPVEPWPFLRQIVPFINTSEAIGEPFQALVPTKHTLGCSWKWRGTSLDAEAAERLGKKLTDSEAYAKGSVDQASYFWLQPLGLVAPIEGKNRADFLRGRDVELIPAHVTAKSYPEPHRLKIYRVMRNRVEHVWAVLDDRWLQKVDHPSWAIPLLEAYGVETAQWPHEFPTESTVQRVFFELPWEVAPIVQSRILDASIIDLQQVAQTITRDDESVVAALVDLDGVKVDPRVWIASIAGAFISIAAVAAMPDRWADARIIPAMAFGASTALAFFPLLRRLVVPRGMLKG